MIKHKKLLYEIIIELLLYCLPAGAQVLQGTECIRDFSASLFTPPPHHYIIVLQPHIWLTTVIKVLSELISLIIIIIIALIVYELSKTNYFRSCRKYILTLICPISVKWISCDPKTSPQWKEHVLRFSVSISYSR